MTDDRIMGALAYALGWVSGLIVYFVKKDSKFARFHGLQSILLSIVGGILMGGAMIAVWIIGMIALVASGTIGMLVIIGGLLLITGVSLVLWVFMMYKAYKGEMYKLPVIGGIAEKHS